MTNLSPEKLRWISLGIISVMLLYILVLLLTLNTEEIFALAKQNTLQFLSAIIRALKDGYGQAEIVRYLDLSAALISYIFRSLNANKKSASKGISYGH